MAEGVTRREVMQSGAVLAVAPSRYPTHARSGPDWFAFAGNWLVEWERTGDTRWRDKVAHGLDVIASMPLGMFSGPQFGYDPSTATLHDIGLELSDSYHLVSIFGGAELMSELLQLIDAPHSKRYGCDPVSCTAQATRRAPRPWGDLPPTSTWDFRCGTHA